MAGIAGSRCAAAGAYIGSAPGEGEQGSAGTREQADAGAPRGARGESPRPAIELLIIHQASLSIVPTTRARGD